ncbi:class I SAM-dependent methyltransferase [Candidatus Woesearchaeota archaeon]|nr:class I SAM-dependent methyltransferase [Candidatus Woesearchaeota archaeon]
MGNQKRKHDIMGNFDRATPTFAKWVPSRRFKSIFDKTIVHILESFSKEKIRILEIGCGHGTWLEAINKLDFSKKIRYTGIDFSEKRIEAAKKFFKKNKNAKFLVADYFEYNDNKKYDLIFFIEVFQYVDKKDSQKFLEKAKSMLEENGNIAIIDKEKYSIHSLKVFLGKLFGKLPYYYRHVHYPSFSALEKLAGECGLNVAKRARVKEFNAVIFKAKA